MDSLWTDIFSSLKFKCKYYDEITPGQEHRLSLLLHSLCVLLAFPQIDHTI